MSEKTLAEVIEEILFKGRNGLEGIEETIRGEISESYDALIDVWEIDCGGKWFLYVKTGVVALGHALWLLLVPDLGEILENYLEPKAGRRGGRRGQRNERGPRVGPDGRPRTGFRGGIPDVDQAIADMIPGREALAGRTVGPGETIFWKQINVGDRIFFYWLLVNAYKTFWVKWQSGLAHSQECTAPNDGTATFNINWRTIGDSNNLWTAKTNLAGLFEENLEVLNGGVVQLPLSNTFAKWITGFSLVINAVKGPNPESGTVKMTLQVWQTAGPGGLYLINETDTFISANENEIGTGYIDAAFFVPAGRIIECLINSEHVEGTGFERLEVSGQCAFAIRNTEFG